MGATCRVSFRLSETRRQHVLVLHRSRICSACFSKTPPLLIRDLFSYSSLVFAECNFIYRIYFLSHPSVLEFPLEKCMVLVKMCSLPQNSYRLLPYLRFPKRKEKTKLKKYKVFRQQEIHIGLQCSCRNMYL